MPTVCTIVQGYLTRESIVTNVPYVCRAWRDGLDKVTELWWQCDLTGTNFDENVVYGALARRKPQELRLGAIPLGYGNHPEYQASRASTGSS